MKTNHSAEEKFTPHLKIIRGKNKPVALRALINGAWSFGYISLWNGINLSAEEISFSKKVIEKIILESAQPAKECGKICERILMAKNYIHGKPGKFIPIPSLWFDENNCNGFAGTAAWLDAVTKIRKSLPDYRKNLKALGEAVAEFSEDSTIKNYTFWTGYFIERKDANLLRAFQLFTSHYFFKIN